MKLIKAGFFLKHKFRTKCLFEIIELDSILIMRYSAFVSLRFYKLVAVCVFLILPVVWAFNVLPVVRSENAVTQTAPTDKFHRHKHRDQLMSEPQPFDPPEVTIGERLFLETRFAQLFAVSGVGVNQELLAGDPSLFFTQTTAAPLPGPFAGMSMNCRACHLVDEQVNIVGGGMRTYGDFAFRSPIPERGDGHFTTPRNSPSMVNASLSRDAGKLFHFDGEFVSLTDLVKSAFTGRNFGWMPRESNAAISQVARVIREDNGRGELAQEFGGLSYQVILTGTDPSIPPEFKLPKNFRVNVATATNNQILNAVAELVASYTEHLEFSKDEDGNFNLSPFDVFLEINGLPRQPGSRETDIEFGRRLVEKIRLLDSRNQLVFVYSNPNIENGGFEFHSDQQFRFARTELEGLFVFFNEPQSLPLSPAKIESGGIGNCVACHAPPAFTDFRMHNTGATQAEYDSIHGANAFANLEIPRLEVRLQNHDSYLPATSQHPDANGRFRAVPSKENPNLTDLGLWNIFANPDFPKPQNIIRQMLCGKESKNSVNCSSSALLPKSIAFFKTAGLRDLGHGAPYLHNGQFATLEQVVALYHNSSALQRNGHLRNGSPELSGIALRPEDVDPLVAFLRSLNEDYQ